MVWRVVALVHGMHLYTLVHVHYTHMYTLLFPPHADAYQAGTTLLNALEAMVANPPADLDYAVEYTPVENTRRARDDFGDRRGRRGDFRGDGRGDFRGDGRRSFSSSRRRDSYSYVDDVCVGWWFCMFPTHPPLSFPFIPSHFLPSHFLPSHFTGTVANLVTGSAPSVGLAILHHVVNASPVLHPTLMVVPVHNPGR